MGVNYQHLVQNVSPQARAMRKNPEVIMLAVNGAEIDEDFFPPFIAH
jgi:hypothetical protein